MVSDGSCGAAWCGHAGSGSVVVALRRPDEDAEVVVPYRDRAADAGDREEDADQDVARLGAVAAVAGPEVGGDEGVDGEQENEAGDGEADDGLDRPGHVGAAP